MRLLPSSVQGAAACMDTGTLLGFIKGGTTNVVPTTLLLIRSRLKQQCWRQAGDRMNFVDIAIRLIGAPELIVYVLIAIRLVRANSCTRHGKYVYEK
jgi:hypothetical protein